MMNRLTSNSVDPKVRLIDAAMTMNAITTTGAVARAPCQPQRTAPQNSEKMKYVKNGLDGPSVRYWNTENTAMSATWVASGSHPVLGRCHMTPASTMAYTTYPM